MYTSTDIRVVFRGGRGANTQCTGGQGHTHTHTQQIGLRTPLQYSTRPRH